MSPHRSGGHGAFTTEVNLRFGVVWPFCAASRCCQIKLHVRDAKVTVSTTKSAAARAHTAAQVVESPWPVRAYITSRPLKLSSLARKFPTSVFIPLPSRISFTAKWSFHSGTPQASRPRDKNYDQTNEVGDGPHCQLQKPTRIPTPRPVDIFGTIEALTILHPEHSGPQSQYECLERTHTNPAKGFSPTCYKAPVTGNEELCVKSTRYILQIRRYIY